MSAADCAEVAVLEEEEPGGWSRKTLQAYPEQVGVVYCCKVVTIDDRIVGYLIGRGIADEMEIHRLVVVKQWRRQGIGHRLLQDFFACMKMHGIRSCFLEVRSRNDAALSFYENEGFYRCGFRRRYYENPDDDALVFRKDLAFLKDGDTAKTNTMVMGL